MTPTPATWLSICVATALTACAYTDADKVRARAATDLRCDKESVAVEEVGALGPEDTLYTATGCGRSQKYVCTQTMIDQVRAAPMAPRTDCYPGTRASSRAAP